MRWMQRRSPSRRPGDRGKESSCWDLQGSNPGLRATITDGGVGDNYTRLHALGADAFLVQNDFQRLQAGADALFRGDTGLLRMGPDLIIRREMSLAVFDSGELKRP